MKLEWARASKEKLSSLGVESISLQEYPGLGHGASPESFADLQSWLGKALPAI